jgi:large subunit ribosomal protein L18
MASAKKESRLRRARKTRLRIAQMEAKRLVVYKTNLHIYAQVINEDGNKVLAQVSTLTKSLGISNGSNIAAAKIIGSEIAKKAKTAGVTEVAFDRSGFKYHGRIKALADSARENGLVF